MQLYIQDPFDEEASFLHEKMLEACGTATRGAGAFAFVTNDGVDLLIRDQIFERFATRGTFDLVVGIDEVTNVRALTALREASNELPGLRVRVFYHDFQQALFHPKFSWFRNNEGGFLITGSGNLTVRGLRGNWEAFTVHELRRTLADAIETQWTRWIDFHTAHLRLPDDENVLARAAQNIRMRRRIAAGAVVEGEEVEAEEAHAEPALERRMLIAEIPRASNRWNQANFDLNSFSSFFGAQPGRVQRVVLQHVNEIGALGLLESRPSVAVRSRNFRFELEAASGLPYPRVGRPIAVFLEIAPRTFRYRLLMPDDPQHTIVDALLNTLWTGSRSHMRRIITNEAVVRGGWPDSPLWLTPNEIED